MASRIEQRPAGRARADRGPDRTGAALKALGIGVVVGGVYAASLSLAHLAWDDADVGWDRIVQRSVLGVVVLPIVFAVAAVVRGSGGADRTAGDVARRTSARIGLALALLGVVVLLALRSYSRMAS